MPSEGDALLHVTKKRHALLNIVDAGMGLETLIFVRNVLSYGFQSSQRLGGFSIRSNYIFVNLHEQVSKRHVCSLLKP